MELYELSVHQNDFKDGSQVTESYLKAYMRQHMGYTPYSHPENLYKQGGKKYGQARA